MNIGAKRSEREIDQTRGQVEWSQKVKIEEGRSSKEAVIGTRIEKKTWQQQQKSGDGSDITTRREKQCRRAGR